MFYDASRTPRRYDMGMNYRNIAIGHCISTTARWRLGFATILTGLSLTLSACSIVLVAPYDEAAVSRITEISKSVLKFYDDLLALPGEKRHAAVTGPLTVAVEVAPLGSATVYVKLGLPW